MSRKSFAGAENRMLCFQEQKPIDRFASSEADDSSDEIASQKEKVQEAAALRLILLNCDTQIKNSFSVWKGNKTIETLDDLLKEIVLQETTDDFSGSQWEAWQKSFLVQNALGAKRKLAAIENPWGLQPYETITLERLKEYSTPVALQPGQSSVTLEDGSVLSLQPTDSSVSYEDGMLFKGKLNGQQTVFFAEKRNKPDEPQQKRVPVATDDDLHEDFSKPNMKQRTRSIVDEEIAEGRRPPRADREKQVQPEANPEPAQAQGPLQDAEQERKPVDLENDPTEKILAPKAGEFAAQEDPTMQYDIQNNPWGIAPFETITWNNLKKFDLPSQQEPGVYGERFADGTPLQLGQGATSTWLDDYGMLFIGNPKGKRTLYLARNHSRSNEKVELLRHGTTKQSVAPHRHTPEKKATQKQYTRMPVRPVRSLSDAQQCLVQCKSNRTEAIRIIRQAVASLREGNKEAAKDLLEKHADLIQYDKAIRKQVSKFDSEETARRSKRNRGEKNIRRREKSPQVLKQILMLDLPLISKLPVSNKPRRDGSKSDSQLIRDFRSELDQGESWNKGLNE